MTLAMKRSALEKGRRGKPDEQVAIAGHVLLVVSQAGDIVTVNEANGLTQTARENLHGLSLADVFDDADAELLKRALSRALRSRSMQVEQASADDAVHEFLCIPQGRDRALLVLRDVSESRHKLDRAEALAFRDDVTGLPNRQSLLAELARVLDWQRIQEGRLALILIDVQGGEDIAGSVPDGSDDHMLKEMASRLHDQLRGVNDTAEDDIERYSVVARTDYRQFGIILPAIDSGEDAESVATRLVESLRQPMSLGTRVMTMGAAAGIALYPQDGNEAEELFSNAHAAAQDARHREESNYCFHTGTVRLRALQRQDAAADLRSALERGEFVIGFQPIVAADSGELRAVEALLRWPTEIFGARTTQKIITMAEYTGLIVDIGEWVIANSLKAYRGWQDATNCSVRLAVNLSTREFVAPRLAERIEKMLADAGVEPGCLDIEIRENVLFRDALKNFETARSLEALGVGLVLDDFGTGSSSVAHLAESPITGLKIDGSYVAGIDANAADRATCRAAIGVARSLECTVTGEGVETGQQADYLRENRCDNLQGFLVSEALSAEDLQSYIEALGSTDKARAS